MRIRKRRPSTTAAVDFATATRDERSPPASSSSHLARLQTQRSRSRLSLRNPYSEDGDSHSSYAAGKRLQMISKDEAEVAARGSFLGTSGTSSTEDGANSLRNATGLLLESVSVRVSKSSSQISATVGAGVDLGYLRQGEMESLLAADNLKPPNISSFRGSKLLPLKSTLSSKPSRVWVSSCAAPQLSKPMDSAKCQKVKDNLRPSHDISGRTVFPEPAKQLDDITPGRGSQLWNARKLTDVAIDTSDVDGKTGDEKQRQSWSCSKGQLRPQQVHQCNRKDGRGWQCAKRVKEGATYCEHHLVKIRANHARSAQKLAKARRRKAAKAGEIAIDSRTAGGIEVAWWRRRKKGRRCFRSLHEIEEKAGGSGKELLLSGGGGGGAARQQEELGSEEHRQTEGVFSGIVLADTEASRHVNNETAELAVHVRYGKGGFCQLSGLDIATSFCKVGGQYDELKLPPCVLNTDPREYRSDLF